MSWGIEINRWLVRYAQYKSYTRGLSGKTRFFKADLWKHDFQQYANVCIFVLGSKYYM